LHLRHDGQRPAFRVLEESHPFLGAVGVPVDHVRRVDELDSAPLQLLVSLLYPGDPEVKKRLRHRWRIGLSEQQARAAAVEEREIAERVEVPQAERLAVPALRAADIADGAGYLPDRSDLEVVHWSTPLSMQHAAFRRLEPLAQSLAVGQAEFAEHVLYVEFVGILADAPALGDLPVRHAVLDGMCSLPLRGSENIVVRRPPPPLAAGHGEILAPPSRNFPPPWSRARWYRRSRGSSCRNDRRPLG